MSVDNRVVNMEFRNHQFESGIAQSVKSLDKLKDSLHMEDSAKSLADITKAADKVSLASIAESIDALTDKFSAFNVFKTRIFSDIAHEAYTTGKRLVESMSIDQVKAGWGKYEDKTKAVQTIVNATGLSIDEVNDQLMKLNWFTDETSYSFTDMVSNIGKFTSAGVDLDVAVTAMMGIANEAALAGQGVNEASRAMYNFAQAIGTGTVKLMDWRSIENANMATTEFKQTIIDTALEIGTLKKNSDGLITTNVDGQKALEVSAQNFNEALSQGWFTSEVLIKSLGQYGNYADELYKVADGYDTCAEAMANFNGEGMELGEKAFRAAQEAKTLTDAIDATKEAVASGWMQTFEIIFGNYEEAKVLWTDMANYMWDIFASGAEARNELLEDWANFKPTVDFEARLDENGIRGLRGQFDEAFLEVAKESEMTGRELLVQGFYNVFEGIIQALDLVKEAFANIFPPVTAEMLYNITKKFEGLTQKFKMGEDTAEKFKTVFEGVFSTVNLVYKAVKPLATGFINLISRLKPVVGLTGNAVVEIASFMNELNASDDILAFLGERFDWFKSYVQPIIDKIVDGIAKLKETFASAAEIDLSGFKAFASKFSLSALPIEKVGNVISKVFGGIAAVIEKFLPVIKKVGGFLFNVLKSIFSRIADTITGFNAENLGNMLNAGGLFALVMQLSSFTSGFKKEGKGLFSALKGFLNKGGDFFAGIKSFFNSLSSAIDSFSKKQQAQALKEIAIALAIFAGSLFVLALIDPDKLENSLLLTAGILVELLTSMVAIEKIVGKKGGQTLSIIAKSLISLAIAVGILAVAMLIISAIDPDKLGMSLAVILSLVTAMTVSAIALSRGLKNTKGAVKGLLNMAVAIVILAAAMKIIATIPEDSFGRALGGIIALIAAMTLVSILANGKGMGLGKSMGLIAMATAVVILSAAVSMLAKLPIKQLIKGVGAISTLMIVMAIFARISSGSKGVFGAAVAMVVIAGAIHILIPALQKLSSMSLSGLAKGLGGLAVSLTLMVLAMRLASGFTTGAIGILLIAISLKLLLPILERFASMSMGEIGKMILALVGVLAALAAGAFLMLPVIPVFIAFGAAILMFGIGCVTAAAGIALLAGAMLLLSASFATVSGVTSIITSVVANLPTILVGAINGLIVALLDLIANSADGLRTAITALVNLLIEVAKDNIPGLVDALLVLIDEVLTSFAAHAGPIVDKLLKIIVDVIDALANRLPEIVIAIGRLVGKLFKALADTMSGANLQTLIKMVLAAGVIGVMIVALSKLKPFLKDALISAAAMAVIMLVFGLIFSVLSRSDPGKALTVSLAMSAVLLSLSACIFVLSMIPVTAALTAIESLAIAVAGLVAILAVLGGIAQIPGFAWLMGEGIKVVGLIGEMIGTFFGSIASGFASGFTKQLPRMGQDLADFMTNAQPFFDGLNNVQDGVLNGVKALAEAILILTAADLLSGIANFLTLGTSGLINGGNPIKKFAKEIASLGPGLTEFAKSTEGIDGESAERAANSAKILAEFAKALPNGGGWLGAIVGDNSMAAFGEELASFGPNLVEFADMVKDLDPDVVEKSATAASALAEFAKALPNEGGWISSVLGDSNLTKFAEDLVVLGPNLTAYSESIKDLDTDVVEKSAAAGLALAEMANAIPSTEGVIGSFVGNNDMSKFGENLVSFGTSLRDFSYVLESANFSNMRIAASAIKTYADIAVMLDGVDTKNLKKFGSASVDMVEAFLFGFTDRKAISLETAAEYISSIADAIGESVIASDGKVTAAGKIMATTFKSGFTSTRNQLESAANTVVNWLVTKIRAGHYKFQEAGSYLIEGLKKGILSQGATDGVDGAVDEVSNRAKNVLEANWEINSPSKYAHRMGAYFTKGAANGILGEASSAEDSAETMGTRLRDAFTNAIAGSISLMRENDTFMPTIRPVLDDSEIQNGVRNLNSLFSGTSFGGAYSKAISASLAAETARRRIIASTANPNKDVVAALETLGDRMDAIDEDILNMRIVFNDGTIAGKIARPLDKRYGKTINRKKRGM